MGADVGNPTTGLMDTVVRRSGRTGDGGAAGGEEGESITGARDWDEVESGNNSLASSSCDGASLILLGGRGPLGDIEPTAILSPDLGAMRILRPRSVDTPVVVTEAGDLKAVTAAGEESESNPSVLPD